MKVRVRVPVVSKVAVRQMTRTAVIVGIQGPPGVSSGFNVGDITDVDDSVLTDGCILVYNASTQKWVAQTLLNKQQTDVGDESF